MLLPVGHLTSSTAVPDVLTDGATKRLVAFEAIGAVVSRLLPCAGTAVGCFNHNYEEQK